MGATERDIGGGTGVKSKTGAESDEDRQVGGRQEEGCDTQVSNRGPGVWGGGCWGSSGPHSQASGILIRAPLLP